MPDQAQVQDQQHQPTVTWTKHTFTCRGCGELCRASQEAIDEHRESVMTIGYKIEDADIVASFDYCFNCLDGSEIPGEKVYRSIRLTDDEVLAVQCGMEVADDGRSEPVTGYWSAQEKLGKVAKQVLAGRGHPAGTPVAQDDRVRITASVASPDPTDAKMQVVATPDDTLSLDLSNGRRYVVRIDDGSLVLERLA